MTWNTDLTNIPRDRRVLIAHPRDGKVYATTWVEPSKFTKGRWSGWTEGTEPVAWQHYPEHPSKIARSKALDELGELDGQLLASEPPATEDEAA